VAINQTWELSSDLQTWIYRPTTTTNDASTLVVPSANPAACVVGDRMYVITSQALWSSLPPLPPAQLLALNLLNWQWTWISTCPMKQTQW